MTRTDSTTHTRAFSVLLPVYEREKPENLSASLQSISSSTVCPEQVVVVEDGPIPGELRGTIDSFRSMLPIHSVRLAQNRGVAAALNAGLHECAHDLVARCDSDDINRSDRFERELQILESAPDVGVVGSDTLEFDDRTGELRTGRKLPSDPKILERFARLRNPMNHPTTMYRRNVILSLGGYPEYRGFEDYALWGCCIMNGVKLRNISEPLVHMRAGASQHARRRGIGYAKDELRLARYFYKVGFFNAAEALSFISTRIPVRILPPSLVSFVYRAMLR